MAASDADRLVEANAALADGEVADSAAGLRDALGADEDGGTAKAALAAAIIVGVDGQEGGLAADTKQAARDFVAAVAAASAAAVVGSVGGKLPVGADVDGAEGAWGAVAVAVLDARDATIGHVLRFDSSAKVLEIYVD